MEGDLQKALRDHPDSFEANHQLGEFYLSVGDLKTGIPYLEKAQKLKPEDYANGYDLAVAYLEAKSPGPARSLLQDMLRRKDTAELHNLLGEADEALGDPTSAVKEYQLAAHMDPNEKNIFDWGNELLLHDTVEPAIEVFKRGVCALSQLSADVHRLGHRLLFPQPLRRSDRGALPRFRPEPLGPAALPVSRQDVQRFGGEGRRGPEAHEAVHGDQPKQRAGLLLLRPQFLERCARGGQGVVDLAEVEALLRKSISLDPRLADAHLQLGVLLQDQHRDQEAIPEFKAAIRFKPDDPDAHYRLAQAYVRTGDKERSQEEFQLYDKLHEATSRTKLKNAGTTPRNSSSRRIPPQNVFLAGC